MIIYNVTKRNKKLGSQAPMFGFISDLETKTENSLSKKIKIKARIIPTAKFKPIPPLFLVEATATARIVNIKTVIGKV